MSIRIKTLAELQNQIETMAAIIDAPHKFLPTYADPIDGGNPCVESCGGGYRYFAVEHGNLTMDKITTDLDELLYWVFKDVIFEMALDYELHHRRGGVDFRRMYFAKKVELMTALDQNWGKRFQAEMDEILKKHPFNDTAF